MRKLIFVVIVFMAACSAGCGRDPNTVRMATTTSTENSGLLDHLLPAFEKETGIKVHVLAQGTGKALKSGELGNVDLVFVHARSREDKFVANGFGVLRKSVMKNDFVVLGPATDPAKVKGSASAADAFRKISESKSPFCSRGDGSGTNIKEKEIWSVAKVEPSGAWYLEVGKGMGGTLTMANEKSAYTIADRGTYIKFKKKIRLVVLFEGGEFLENPYGIIAVNPKRHPNVNYAGAVKFIDWITSPEGRAAIDEYRVDGQQLFFSTAK